MRVWGGGMFASLWVHSANVGGFFFFLSLSF